jgi:flavin-dependent dehydrogenase
VLQRFGHVLIEGVKIKADLLTFNKPELIKDLLQGAEIKLTPLGTTGYDMLIDATGVARAFLPPIEDDIILPCMQCRIQTDTQFENRIKLVSIGYAWCFPLMDNEYHIGCGSFVLNPPQIMEQVDWLGGNPSQQGMNAVCACNGKIRITGPQYSRPFVTNGKIWGVGEAIGCVAPLAGDGIVPGMKSVQILMRYWDDPDGYTEAILEEFSWMEGEREVIDKLRRGENLGINDARVLKNNSRRMGMEVGLEEALMLLKNLIWRPK